MTTYVLIDGVPVPLEEGLADPPERVLNPRTSSTCWYCAGMADPKTVQTQLRLPSELHAVLVGRARSHGLSLNETIVRALRYATVQADPALKVTTTKTVEVEVL